MSSLEELNDIHRKERKELIAITQKMKHSVPKGDKKKKRDTTAEISQMLANLELKHEQQIKEFEHSSSGISDSNTQNEVDHSQNEKLHPVDVCCASSTNSITEKDECTSSQNVPRLSKAQKRRNKKAMQEKERNIAIAAQELENLSGLRNLESEEIKNKLSERQLTIHEVPSDGNCLYKAVEHQLHQLNLQDTTVQSLRELTSSYMLSHMEDYIPFLTCPETGDVLTKDQYVKYCEDIAGTSAWGGHIEIQALSNICETQIEVIQAEGPSVIAGTENEKPKLILSYHRHVYGLGEHYNSVVPVSE